MGALQHSGDALQSHAGIDGGFGQRHALLRADLVVLHEDEIPDLHEAVAVLVRAAGRASGDVLAMIVEDLRTGTARARLAHRPEIVGAGDAHDLLVGQPGDLLPQVEGLVIVYVDGDHEALLGQAELPGDQVPRQLDGPLLEVVAEGEVAQHLEEGVMPRRIPHIVQVVVLAACAHALLRRGGSPVGPRLQPREDVLELHHAGVREHQRRVVARHERARRHHLVPLLPDPPVILRLL